MPSNPLQRRAFGGHLNFAIYHWPSGDARSPAHVKRQQHNVNSVSKPLSSEKDWPWAANDK